MTSRTIYFDYAAATPTDPTVVEAMQPFFTEYFGNPASSHTFGDIADKAVENAKKDIAKVIGCKPDEICFTSSGTESNNLAILGTARANRKRGQHIITTNIEHPSVYNACQALEKDGWRVTYLKVDECGSVNLEELTNALSADTTLCSIHYGNSEIGTLPKIKQISEICHEHNVPIHIDACQAMGYLPVDVAWMGIDLLTFNGSKMYGPKGVAVLYVKTNLELTPIMYGGGQQKSLRSGTLNVPGIVGLAQAVKLSFPYDTSAIRNMRDQLQKKIQTELSERVVVNVAKAERLPNHLSLTFIKRKNTDLVGEFNKKGIAVSAGSACSSSSLSDSHVLNAIGIVPELIHATIRVTLGRPTTQLDSDRLLTAIKEIA